MIRSLLVLLKLAPSVIALKKDRKKWLKKESTPSDIIKYRKNARRALKAFVSLGPVYIKLGQWLSSRADILPQPYMDELSKLQDDVPVTPFHKVKPILERDLGPLDQAFDRISTEAISGASLGQVYLARLYGKDVVIKVRRPGIDNIVKRDLKGLKSLLPLALRFIDPNLGITVKAMFAQFVETMHEEMDYDIELKNLLSVRQSTKDNYKIIVPQVYPERSTRRIITMEYLPGTKVTDVDALEAMGIDRQQLVVDVHKVFFLMLLRHPIFHADPHPGNISVAPDGRLILYDYGMVGRLDDRTRLKLIRLYVALADRDPARSVVAMDQLGMLVPDFNRRVIEQALSLSIDTMHGRRADEIEVNVLMELVNRTMGQFPFLLPKHLSLYMRMATLIEGIYKIHRVDFTFMTVLKEIITEENMIQDAYVDEMKEGLSRFVKSLSDVIELAPEMRRFLDDARSVNAKPTKTKSALPGIILGASVFVGSAMIYSAGETAAGIVGAMASVAIVAGFAILGRR